MPCLGLVEDTRRRTLQARVVAVERSARAGVQLRPGNRGDDATHHVRGLRLEVHRVRGCLRGAGRATSAAAAKRADVSSAEAYAMTTPAPSHAYSRYLGQLGYR